LFTYSQDSGAGGFLQGNSWEKSELGAQVTGGQAVRKGETAKFKREKGEIPKGRKEVFGRCVIL
jgi:hypothetical protein